MQLQDIVIVIILHVPFAELQTVLYQSITQLTSPFLRDVTAYNAWYVCLYCTTSGGLIKISNIFDNVCSINY